jgi:CHAT domain-containing protein
LREAELLRGADEQTLVLAGARATEAEFRRLAPQARLLHLATHGVVEARVRHEVASLLMTPGPEAGHREDDGFLDLDEIRGLSLAAELTVLSACSSHDGRQVRGEGVFALTRAFLSAGSSSVVGTLWPVQDYATAWAMTQFYDRVFAPSPADRQIAKALHEVKRMIRNEDGWESPAFWAAFVCTGLR